MAQLLRLVSGVDDPPAKRAFVPRSDNQRPSAESLASDLALVRFSRVNLLVVGDDDAVKKLLTSLWQSLATPVVARHRGERLQLSPTFGRVGTIVVHDVDTLPRRDQRALYQWMDEGNGRTRVVSTASKSLQPLLESGAFNAELYYRLNMVTLDLTSRHDLPV